MDDQINSGLECVDAKIGERILNLESPALDADERELLEAHKEVCAFCRLALDLHLKLGVGIRDGSLEVDTSAVLKPARRHDWMGWAAATAIAASLVLMFVLPPRPVGSPLVVRGANKTRFLRPVEGEVVRAGDLELGWTEVPGADAYRVQVTGLHGGSTWTGISDEAHLVVPEGAVPAGEETYRVLLSTVPDDLLPPGGASVSFRTGGSLAMASHRVRKAQPVSYLFALSGLALAIASVINRRS